MPDSRAPPPRSILITGASAGLGRALAIGYAAPGVTLALLARRPGPLAEVAAHCRDAGATVLTATADVRDRPAIAAFVAEIERSPARGIDLAIANAGLFSGRSANWQAPATAEPPGLAEPPGAAHDVVTVNLLGAMATVDAVLPGMRRRGAGRIALISSLAALQPLADAPAYSASKAALLAYGEALRDLLAAENIQVSVVLPGHIETAQTAAHIGPLPLLVSPTEAARRIRAGLAADRATIAFPRRIHWLIRLGRLLPARMRRRALDRQRFTVEAPDRDAD